jgi:hypothetical protein
VVAHLVSTTWFSQILSNMVFEPVAAPAPAARQRTERDAGRGRAVSAPTGVTGVLWATTTWRDTHATVLRRLVATTGCAVRPPPV